MPKNCSNCGHENIPTARFCGSCGFNLIEKDKFQNELGTCINCDEKILENQNHCSSCGFKIKSLNDSRATQMLGRSGVFTSNEAKLTAVSLNNIAGTDLKLNKAINFIKRDMIDKNDRSISINEHCKISNEDGKWYLENLASNKAVFVQVNEKIELTNDLIVLIGNTKFYIFNSK